MCSPTKKAPLPATQASPRENKPTAACDHVAASYNVSNHGYFMQNVGKQQTEGHELAQHQLSN